MPPTLRDFILKACARNPAGRYQNVAEALEAAKRLIHESGDAGGEEVKAKRNVRMFYLVYDDEQKNGLSRAMEDFSQRVQSLGIELKTGETIEL